MFLQHSRTADEQRELRGPRPSRIGDWRNCDSPSLVKPFLGMSRYFLTLFFALSAAGGIVTTAAGCTEEEADPKQTSSSGLLTEL